MDRRVRELGVTGVPFFIFDGKVAVSGAQEPDTLVDAMLQAIRDDERLIRLNAGRVRFRRSWVPSVPLHRGEIDARRAPDGVPVDRDVARDDRAQVRRVLPDRVGEPVVGRAGVARQPRRGPGRAGRADGGGAAGRRPPHLRSRQGRILLERRRGRADPRRGGIDHLVRGPSASSNPSRSCAWVPVSSSHSSPARRTS